MAWGGFGSGEVIYAPISDIQIVCDSSDGISLVAEQEDIRANQAGVLIRLLGWSIGAETRQEILEERRATNSQQILQEQQARPLQEAQK